MNRGLGFTLRALCLTYSAVIGKVLYGCYLTGEIKTKYKALSFEHDGMEFVLAVSFQAAIFLFLVVVACKPDLIVKDKV